MGWDMDNHPYWVAAKGTVPVWVRIGAGEWRNTYIQARPIGSTDQVQKPLFVMNQAVRLERVNEWAFGADVYNPNDTSVQFTVHGI